MSKKYEIDGYCGYTLHGKIWKQGSSGICDRAEVTITMFPKMERGFIPSKICNHCLLSSDKHTKRTPG